MASGLNTLTKTSMNDQGTIVNTTIFPPIGVSHDLQEKHQFDASPGNGRWNDDPGRTGLSPYEFHLLRKWWH